ncbi:MAG: hypothetical protein WBA12_12050 [Catalinimonas sp.]
MNRLLLLAANDFRMVFRDAMLRGFFLLPLLILVLVVWGVPPLLDAYPAVRDYKHVILMGACMQTVTMFGFITGFVFLEEKDQGVFAALRVLPVTAGTMLSVRLLLGTAVAWSIGTAIILLTGWLDLHAGAALLLSLPFALLTPLLTLLPATFARNKVEGLAHFKVWSFLCNLPLLVYFLDHPWLRVLAVIPTYWPYRAVAAAEAGESIYPSVGVGLLVLALGLGVMLRIFGRRTF